MQRTSTEGPAAFKPETYRYRAFLSYSRADQKVVDDMFRRLSSFRTPNPLLKEVGDFGSPPRSLPIFLDRKSAQLGATVPDRLRQAVIESAFLVLFCSEASVRSEWVAREIEIFLEAHPPHHILPVFLRHSLQQAPQQLMPAPLAALGERAPIGGDLLADGGPRPVAHKLLGAMLGFPQDRISREQERADRQRRNLERAALGSIAELATGAAGFAWKSKTDADKAARSLEVSLKSLESTAPFMGQLIRDGRIRTRDLEPFANHMSETFRSMTDGDLRPLPDLRFGFGQVLTSSAAFYATTGDNVARLADAERAYRTLKVFETDPGPDPQLKICAAALELADARGADGDYPGAIAAAEACARVATDELSYQQADADASARLHATRIAAMRMQAQLLRAQSQFTDSLARLSTAESADYLGSLAGLAGTDSEYTVAVGTGIYLDRAQTLEAMGRYEEASSIYEGLLEPDAPGLEGDAWIVSELGAARAAGLVGDRHEEALARLAPVIARIETETSSDPSLRGRLGLLAQLLTLRGQILADAPERPALETEPNDANAREALASFARAGDLLEGLLLFDPDSRTWRSLDASRRIMYADFLFRQWEASGDQSLICTSACLTEARSNLEAALEILSGIRQPDPGVTYMQADARTRLARVVRHSGADGAVQLLDAVEPLLVELKERSKGDRGVRVLEANLIDERADNFLAQGRIGEAVAAWQTTLQLQADLLGEEPDWVAIRRDVTWTRLKIADALARGDSPKATEDAYRAACVAAAAAGGIRSALLLRDSETIRRRAEAAGFPCR